MRTLPSRVQVILGSYYAAGTDLSPWIESANPIVTRAAACATADGTPLTDIELELMERWLAAWLYTKTDPLHTSRSTLSSSASFLRDPKDFLAQAYAFDPSGCLKAQVEGNTVGGAWLGKTETEELTYRERN